MGRRNKVVFFSSAAVVFLLTAVLLLIFSPSLFGKKENIESKEKKEASYALPGKLIKDKRFGILLPQEEKQVERKTSFGTAENQRPREAIAPSGYEARELDTTSLGQLEKPLMARISGKVVSSTPQSVSIILDFFNGFQASVKESENKKEMFFLPQGTVIEVSLLPNYGQNTEKKEPLFKEGDVILGTVRLEPAGPKGKITMLEYQILRNVKKK